MNDQQTPAADKPTEDDQEMNQAMAHIAFPAFWFAQLTHSRRVQRVAVRKNDTDPGLYAVVAADWDVLAAALLHDQFVTGHRHLIGDGRAGARP